jgi:hypothetical protein
LEGFRLGGLKVSGLEVSGLKVSGWHYAKSVVLGIEEG